MTLNERGCFVGFFLIHIDIYLPLTTFAYFLKQTCSPEPALEDCCSEQHGCCWVLICAAQQEANWDAEDGVPGEREASAFSEQSELLNYLQLWAFDMTPLCFSSSIKLSPM